MDSRRRLVRALLILVLAGGFATLVRLICAGWLAQDGAVRLELSACLESSVVRKVCLGMAHSDIAGRSWRGSGRP